MSGRGTVTTDDEWAPLHHTHRQTRAPVITAYVAIVLLAIQSAYIFVYVLDRGQARDEELRRIDERINRSVCDLLDQLPEGGLLDRPRQKYGCGPGIPLESYPPDVQQRLRQQGGWGHEAPPAGAQAPAQPDPGSPSTDGATSRPATAEPPPAAPTDEPNPLLSVACPQADPTCLETP
jgi:hypothetical protein